MEHSGGDRGNSSNVVRYPLQKLAIALLRNSEAINPIILTHKLTDFYLSDVLGAPSDSGGAAPATVTLPAKVTLKESELAGRAGRMALLPIRVADLQVSVGNGKLIGHSFAMMIWTAI